MTDVEQCGDWWQLELQAAQSQLDAIEDWLWTQGALSVTCLPAANASDVLEPDPGMTPHWSRARVQALFSADESYASLHGRLQSTWAARAATCAAAALPDDAQVIRLTALRNEDWQSSWRQHVTARCFGDRLWVQPRDAPLPSTGVAVQLDPGLAFGTGSHPTTALCLQWLALYMPARACVVDFGCGSGILAIAAAKLGATMVYALDHDPQALLATAENAEINGVCDLLQITASEALADGCADVVVANILSGTLIELAPELTRLAARAGTLVMSGVLVEQAAMVRASYPAFDFDADQHCEGWACLIGHRRALAER